MGPTSPSEFMSERCTPQPTKHDLRYLNQRRYLEKVSFAPQRTELEVEIDITFPQKPTHLFKKQIIVEVVGAGFD